VLLWSFGASFGVTFVTECILWFKRRQVRVSDSENVWNSNNDELAMIVVE
jgi:hypothetical protein